MTLISLYSKRIAALVGVALLGVLGACAEPSAPLSSAMRLGPPTLAPRGYLQFCNRRPDQCGLKDPTTAFDTALLQRALQREEWTNVMSFGSHSTPTPAPSRASEGDPEIDSRESRAAAQYISDEIIPLRLWFNAQPDPSGVRMVQPLVSVGGGDGALSGPTPMVGPLTEPLEPAPALDALFGSVKRDPAKTLVFSPALWAHLERVNADINARIRARTDMEAFGVDDYWTLPLDVGGRGEGNCKHYALEKRRALVDAGVSEDALSLAIVRTLDGQTHAVLLVATDRGEFVLDNLTPELLPWTATGYIWLSRQTPGAPLRWASLADGVRGGM